MASAFQADGNVPAEAGTHVLMRSRTAMLDKLTAVEHRYTELTSLLADPGVQGDPSEYRKHARALAEIEPLVERFRQ